MMIRGSRIRQIGWAALFAVCLSAFAALTFRVNAVKSEVRLAERQIVALQKEKIQLETEFQSRANQQQLADWNRIEFGYAAPDAGQYLEGERQLASLGVPRGLDAPNPIRVARAADESDFEAGFPALVSPLTGGAFGNGLASDENEASDARDDSDDSERPATDDAGLDGQSLADRLAIHNPIGAQLAEASE
ncbi:hypothetical protein [Pontixanthobacter sp.]|uniref:hypothetical protein n=1 Tax=Pontixanthobacter sp. TaxID=2792078 RepID=UPI003C7EB6DA